MLYPGLDLDNCQSGLDVYLPQAANKAKVISLSPSSGRRRVNALRRNKMIATNAKSKARLTDSIFSSFVLSVFGWAVLQSYSLRHGASIPAHILVATAGLTLSYVSIRRYQAHWPADAGLPVEQTANTIRTVGWYALLLAVGSALAFFAVAGGMGLLAIFAGGMNFLPWSRIPVCRDRFFVSSGMIAACAAFEVVAFGRSTDPVANILITWVCWMIACPSLMFVLARLGDSSQPKSSLGSPTASRQPECGS
jgi:hypothetical protein